MRLFISICIKGLKLNEYYNIRMSLVADDSRIGVNELNLEIECVLSFGKKDQEFFNIYVPISQMLNKEFVERIFTEEVNEGLFKVSMCVYSKRQHQELQDYEPPDWYFECDGKLLWKENFP